jgi:hypothetical protein|tara:strand:- start:403 stop:888 length:486 start_codon:yes stop_codon:yes gene_type:complete
MFFASLGKQKTSDTAGSKMGGAVSASEYTEEDYESAVAMASPNTRARAPSTTTAMTLMSDFQALSLGGAERGSSGVQHCISCNKQTYCSILCFSSNIREKLAAQPFMYQGKPFCSLDCFFDHFIDKPGLCMWVDSLFSLAVKHRQRLEFSDGESFEGKAKK